MAKLIVISGVPRSGTSLTMDCCVASYGKDKILGSQFPRDWELIRRSDEGMHEFEYRKWEAEQYLSKIDKEKKKRTKLLNPKGFWEHSLFSVKGLNHRVETSEIIMQMKSMDVVVGKIVSGGLMSTDPSLIEKIVYVIRNPYSVAKSQESLERNGKFKTKDGQIVDIFDGEKINSLQMYITQSVMAAKFFLDNPDIPVYFFEYDNLIDNQKETLDGIGQFLSKDFSPAYSVVENGLRRSVPEKKESDLNEDAELVYECFKNQEFQKLVDTMLDPKRAINRQNRSWKCARTGLKTGELTCKKCKENGELTKEFIKWSESQKINWKRKPCAFECKNDLDNPLISIKESIDNNHWLKIKN